MLIDEAAAEMRAVNWHSKQQQQVNQGAMTERYKNNMVFMNMPNFNEFTKSMRTGSLIFRFIIPNLEKILPEITEEYKRLKIESRHIKGDEVTPNKDLYKEKYEEVMNRISKILMFNELNL